MTDTERERKHQLDLQRLMDSHDNGQMSTHQRELLRQSELRRLEELRAAGRPLRPHDFTPQQWFALGTEPYDDEWGPQAAHDAFLHVAGPQQRPRASRRSFFLYEDTVELCHDLRMEFPGCSNADEEDMISFEALRDVIREGNVILEFVGLGQRDQFIRCWDIVALATYVASAVIVGQRPVHPLTREPFLLEDLAVLGLAFCVLNAKPSFVRCRYPPSTLECVSRTNKTLQKQWCEWLELCDLEKARSSQLRTRVWSALRHPYQFFTSLLHQGQAQKPPRGFPDTLRSVKPFADMIHKDVYFQTLTRNLKSFARTQAKYASVPKRSRAKTSR